jgi:hypothetical protein
MGWFDGLMAWVLGFFVIPLACGFFFRLFLLLLEVSGLAGWRIAYLHMSILSMWFDWVGSSCIDEDVE